MEEFLGERLRRLRTERNLTQKQLAAKIGVKNTTVSFYELEERKPSADVLIAMAHVFHVSTDYILGLETEESITLSGLTAEDAKLLRNLADNMRQKNLALEKMQKRR